MRLFLLVYTAVYAAVCVATFGAYFLLVPREEKALYSTGEHLVDGSLLAIGLAGMLLLLTGFAPPLLKHAWKIVSVALVLGQFWLNLRERSRHLARNPGERSSFVRLADFGMLAMLAPSLAFNLIYAFGE